MCVLGSTYIFPPQTKKSQQTFFIPSAGWGQVCKVGNCGSKSAYLNVSRIIVKSTNFPSSGTTSDVGGMISASSKKNTVNESRMDMLNDTFKKEKVRPEMK